MDEFSENPFGRSQVVNEVGQLVFIETAKRGMPRGSYFCADCGYPVLKKRSPPSEHRGEIDAFHFAHYPGCKHGSGLKTKQHEFLSSALAAMCNGETEIKYPGLNRVADAGNGRSFFEVVVSHDIDKDKAQDLLDVSNRVPGFVLYTVKTKQMSQSDVEMIVACGYLQEYAPIISFLRKNKYIERVDLHRILEKKSGQSIMASGDPDTVSHGGGVTMFRCCGPCRNTVLSVTPSGEQQEIFNLSCILYRDVIASVGQKCIHGIQLQKSDQDYMAHVHFATGLNQ